jgi:hypothetical protein
MNQIAVIGGGTMGNGIVHVFAQNGYKVNLIDVKQDMLDKALATITKNMDRQIAKGSLTEEQKAASLQNIQTYTILEEGVNNADLVIEAATENTAIKLQLFRDLDQFAPAHCILASNTSSISITKIASVTKRPEKFPFPVYQIIDSEYNALLVRGEIFGNENYGQLSISSARISTLETDGILFRSQNTANTITTLYADDKNILYWDGKPLISAGPAPFVLPSTIQVSSIKTTNISAFDSTSAIIFNNPINVPEVKTESIKTSTINTTGLYLSNSNVEALLTTDSELTLLWNGAPVGGAGKIVSSYNNLTTSSFSVSSIGSQNSGDVIVFKNEFTAENFSFLKIAISLKRQKKSDI